MDDRELSVVTYTAGINQPVSMSIMHIPTGIMVIGTGVSKGIVREWLMDELGKRITA